MFFFFAFTIKTNAQKTRTYYDYQWKACDVGQARFVSDVVKTDSGWLRDDYFISTQKLQMQGLYEDSATKIANGYFYYYYANGIPESVGRMVHNKEQGLWLSYYNNGYMRDSTVYDKGKPTGTSLSWHVTGYPADSIVYNNDGTAVEVDWHSNGVISGAGRLKDDKMNGVWQFFHNNGRLAAEEVYDTGRLVSGKYFNKDGNMQDTPVNRESAEFPGGDKAWKKFVHRTSYFPGQYHITNANSATFVINVIVDEDGNLVEPFVSVPFNEVFEDIVLKGLKKSPRWLPAIHHNRSVVDYISIPANFSKRQ